MIKIGNACGFWGDSLLAPNEMLEAVPDLDYLTLEYLAELTLSLLAKQHAKDKNLGYAADFLTVLASLPPHKCKIVTNAGGVNPQALAIAAKKIAPGKKIAFVLGDKVRDCAFAYLGAKGIADALHQGADIVITGRVADPSLVVGPCLYHFDWPEDAWDKIAQGIVAGHLIECGAQVTGGMSTNWLSCPHPERIGYPIVEMEPSGEFVLTKPLQSGGCVTLETVKEQLLYELFDPSAYLSPDATVSFTSIQLENAGKDRIRVTGAKGSPPPDTLKVTTTKPIGYRVEGELVVVGTQAKDKAKKAAEATLKRVGPLEETLIECFGSETEALMRIAAFDQKKSGLECLAQEIAPLVTRGPQGIIGYAKGRPRSREVYSIETDFISRQKVVAKVEFV